MSTSLCKGIWESRHNGDFFDCNHPLPCPNEGKHDHEPEPERKERKAPAGVIGPKSGAMDTCWQTPPELLERVRVYFDGAIPYDAATAPDNPTHALSFSTEDGLTRSWQRPIMWPEALPWGVYVNPPYGKVLKEWLAKMSNEASLGAKIIALLPCARWEQEYFQQAMAEADAVCMIRRRVAFIRPSTGDRVGGNTYANMFVGFNTDQAKFVEAFGPLGACFAWVNTAPPPAELIRMGKVSRPRKGA